jgi:hypothetical protein
LRETQGGKDEAAAMIQRVKSSSFIIHHSPFIRFSLAAFDIRPLCFPVILRQHGGQVSTLCDAGDIMIPARGKVL